jgi:hypothetical protein
VSGSCAVAIDATVLLAVTIIVVRNFAYNIISSVCLSLCVSIVWVFAR